ncbi:MAG: HAD family hydrolase [Clostridia bacterium]|nr:HAD family hydrolase [Clostridia bacterium]
MKLTTVLFDLDGTLLPMNENLFIKVYFKNLAARLAPHGYDPEKLVTAIWGGTSAMMKNDGSKTNEAAFWDFFSGVFGERARADEPIFEDFYKNEFSLVRDVCTKDPKADEAIKEIKALGLRTALATNPLFPRIATLSRIEWAGCDSDDFEVITTYENSRYCKPSREYYLDILNEMDVCPEECLMVGNNVDEDMIAETLGMRVFLFPRCIINKDNRDISRYPQGSFCELLEYIKTEL